MAIKVKSGFIYFLREKDVLTGETFDYVKIGKTDYDRPVSERIDDHQTGNPRMILDHESFQVASIDTVETHLHHAFAEYRILGEWFRMDETTLQEAIREGKRIDKVVSGHNDALKAAAEANKMEATEPERAATEEEPALLEEAIQAGEALNRLKAQQNCLEWELRAAMGGAAGIDGILTAIEVSGLPKLDEKGLQEKAPEVYESFLIEDSSLKRSFALATKTRSEAKLEPELAAKQKEFKAQAANEPNECDKPAAKRSTHLAGLHEQYLKAMEEISQAAIKKDITEARIKAACGLAKGIEGICKWSRTIETKMKFDRKSFEQKHPDLLKEHLLPAPLGLRVSVNLMRSYAIA
jgi:hypothetical protein